MWVSSVRRRLGLAAVTVAVFVIALVGYVSVVLFNLPAGVTWTIGMGIGMVVASLVTAVVSSLPPKRWVPIRYLGARGKESR